MTARALFTALANAFDYLSGAGLALYPRRISLSRNRVTWHHTGAAPFWFSHRHATIAQYLAWVSAGHYSLLLNDAALVQLTYWTEGSAVVAHRLAYVPCPIEIDHDLLEAGESIAEIVELQLSDASYPIVQLQSVVRFDFDLNAEAENHPASHLTVNSSTCRIPCVGPLHPDRFIDFVFRHFYPDLWERGREWFAVAETQSIGPSTLVPGEPRELRPHVSWR